jgi:hypothetical protein
MSLSEQLWAFEGRCSMTFVLFMNTSGRRIYSFTASVLDCQNAVMLSAAYGKLASTFYYQKLFSCIIITKLYVPVFDFLLDIYKDLRK